MSKVARCNSALLDFCRLPRLLSFTVFLGALHPALAQDFELFESKIRPALHTHCLSCHHQADPSGGLALDSRDGLRAGGDSGATIDVNAPENSLLVRVLKHMEPGLEMPAKAPKLSEDTIAAFVEWIRQGADDPRDHPESLEEIQPLSWQELYQQRSHWWAFQPPKANTDLDRTTTQAIDAWISEKLNQAQVAASPSADAVTLLRRLSFNLRGLPPTPESLARWIPKLSDPSTAEAAWEQAIDEALNSVEFAEHWARHWMDIVRYAETHGSEDDAYLPFAYRYRDYLVRAFGEDVPIQRLIQEHLAGDLIPPRWNQDLQINESLIGLCFYRLVEFNQTPVDVKREEIAVIDSQIDTIGKAFQGLTISCARCHDHKFDPISDEDYYSLYGILRSTRTAMLCIDRPDITNAPLEKLAELQQGIAERLFTIWQQQVATWDPDISAAIDWVSDRFKEGQLKIGQNFGEIEKLAGTNQPWRKVLAKWSIAPPDSPERKWFELLADTRDLKSGPMDILIHQHRQSRDAWEQLSERSKILFDLRGFDSDPIFDGWRVVGPGLPKNVTTASPSDRPPLGWTVRRINDHHVHRLLQPGYHSNTLTDRASGSLRSPDFVVDSDAISLLCCGGGNARARLVVENFQGDSLLFDTLNPTLRTDDLNWVTMRIRPQWKGLRAHVEILTRDAKPYVGIVKDPKSLEGPHSPSHFGLAMVVAHPADYHPPRLWRMPDPANLPADEHSSVIVSTARSSLDRLATSTHSLEDILWINTLIDEGLLVWNQETNTEIDNLNELFKQVESSIPSPRWIQGVVEDHLPVAQPLLPRGDHKNPGPMMPRKYLSVLGSSPDGYRPEESGRLELAMEITRPTNPLTARVYVNRVWCWLFGEGIVSTVDNFGRMGQEPSHPELLDQLAIDFLEQGWSNKKLIKAILMSQTWRRSTESTDDANAKDPANVLLSHANLRRLPAEAIRDSMLWVAGTLKRPDGGLGTRNYYKSVLEPNKQSPPGPIDGDSRRSIYLEVRRNFPDEFLTAFDFPKPIATVGKRYSTNTPLQSLMLLNDPFVIQQANAWSKAVCDTTSDPKRRIELMYQKLLSRTATVSEIDSALELINNLSPDQNGPAAWEVLAHAMLNMKEAWYVK